MPRVRTTILFAGAILLWRFLLDPLGWHLLDKESTPILLFPSVIVAAATLVLMAFRNDDRLALDERRSGERTQA